MGNGESAVPSTGQPFMSTLRSQHGHVQQEHGVDKWLSVHPWLPSRLYHHYYTWTSYDIPTFVGEAPIEHPLLGGFPRCAVGWFASRRHCSADFLGWGSFASSVAGNGRRGFGIVWVCSMRSHQNHNAKVEVLKFDHFGWFASTTI